MRVGLTVLVAGAALTGCGSFRDVFTSHAETAARVGSKELKSARVAEIIGRLGGPNANPAAAELITGIWVDMSLFGDQVAGGELKTDSATIERLMWPQLSEQKISSWHDTVVARRPAATRDLADSLYNKGEQRLFQHILFMPGGPTAADTAKAKATADRTRPQINAANFGKLAMQFSSDGSKNDGGYLYIAPRGGFVKEFDDAAWALAPGEITGVVKSPFGFHVIRRPTLEESRDRFFVKVVEMYKAHQDSLYMAELSSRVGLVMKPGAAAAIKNALKDIDGSRTSKQELVTSNAGDFTVGDLIRWLNALPPTAIASIKQADDSLLNVFVETLAKNAILLREADSAKIAINPTMYEALALQFKTQVNQLKAAVGLDGPEFSDSSKVAVAERRKLAAEKADQYFEKLITGQAQFVPVPPTLSAELRSTGDFKIYPAGVNRAVELIVAKKAADSAAGGNLPPGAPRPGGLQPAPGGPPTEWPAGHQQEPVIRRFQSLVGAALLLSGGGAATLLSAQRRQDSVVVDRVVAVVGSQPILSSHITERLFQEFPGGTGMPTDPDSLRDLRAQLLRLLINEELMIQEALKDTTIKILDDDVTKSVDALIRTTRARFTSEDAYRRDIRVAGFETPDEYRSWLTEQQRRALQQRQLLSRLEGSGKLKPVAPTEREIREYFEQNKARFPKRSATISFRQIVIPPPAKTEAKARALALADSILQELRKGGDFAAAARRFSMDPGTKELGGTLGWMRRGQNLDQAFEDVAFSLKPGVISDPVETAFGYHLIQVERAQPAEVQIRHILIMPVIDASDADSAAKIAGAVHDAIEKGAAFDSVQRIRHDKAEERELAGFPFDSLPQAYREALTDVPQGKISKVFRLESPTDVLRSKFVILLITERIPAGDVRYEDVKEQIRAGLSRELTQQRYIDKLRAGTLVEIRSG